MFSKLLWKLEFDSSSEIFCQIYKEKMSCLIFRGISIDIKLIIDLTIFFMYI